MTPSDTTPQGAEPREDGAFVGLPLCLQEIAEAHWSGSDALQRVQQFAARELEHYIANRPAPAAPTNGGGRLLTDEEEVDELARWLHDEVEWPDFVPDCHWPLSDKDDGYRGDGGHVRLQPKFAVERFRDIARRLRASGLAALQPRPTQQGGAEDEGDDPAERWTILNHMGGFWTEENFETPDKAATYLRDWQAANPAIDLSRHKVARVLVTMRLNTSEARG